MKPDAPWIIYRTSAAMRHRGYTSNALALSTRGAVRRLRVLYRQLRRAGVGIWVARTALWDAAWYGSMDASFENGE